MATDLPPEGGDSHGGVGPSILTLATQQFTADFISTVTDSALEAVVEWRNRPLERSYPVVYFDALRVKIRDEGSVRNKAVYLALGIAADGTKDVLGIWIEQKEGAKFWLKVMNELRNRGVDPDRGGRRAEGLSGGHYHRLPVSQRADLHRTFKPLLSVLLWLERTPGPGARTQRDLPGRNRGGGRQAVQRVRSWFLGQKISDDCRELATKLATDHSFLRISEALKH